MDALTRGTLEGAQLLLNIVAMLVVFVALVALVNLVIAPYTLQGMLGWVLAPLAWLAGDSVERGARRRRAARHQDGDQRAGRLPRSVPHDASLSERSRMLMTYALCGFANLGSLGIMIGGLGTMCPSAAPRSWTLGIKSIVAGTLATCLTAATRRADPVVGLLQQVHDLG